MKRQYFTFVLAAAKSVATAAIAVAVVIVCPQWLSRTLAYARGTPFTCSSLTRKEQWDTNCTRDHYLAMNSAARDG